MENETGAHMATEIVDWTKPIQWEDGKPAKFIAEIEGKYIVWLYAGGVCAYNKDGTYSKGGRQWITNAPPPPLWPVKRWFVTWEGYAGEAQISGQHRSLVSAGAMASRLEEKGNKNVRIQEATFG